MKKLFLSAVLLAAMATNNVTAQGLLGKIKNARYTAEGFNNETY